MFLSSPPPRLTEGGGVGAVRSLTAKIPTNGKHLSHNVYYETDYVTAEPRKSLILLRTL